MSQNVDQATTIAEKVSPVKDSKENCVSDLLMKDDELMLEVTCGQNQAALCMSRLQLGSKGTCVLFENAWLTPNEFQYVSGRETAKDWKRSIKHHGKSLKVLIAKGILTTSPSQCKCGQCIPVKEGGKPAGDATRPVSLSTIQVSPPTDRTKLHSEQPVKDDSTVIGQQDTWQASNKQYHSLDGRTFQRPASDNIYSPTMWQQPNLDVNNSLNNPTKDNTTHISIASGNVSSKPAAVDASSQIHQIETPDANDNMKKVNHCKLPSPRPSQHDAKAANTKKLHEDSRNGESDSRKEVKSQHIGQKSSLIGTHTSHSEPLKSSAVSNIKCHEASSHRHSSNNHRTSQNKPDGHHHRISDTHISDVKSNSSSNKPSDKTTTCTSSASKCWPIITNHSTNSTTENKLCSPTTDSRQFMTPFTTPYASNFFGSVPQIPMYYQNPYVLWPMAYPPAAASLPYGWTPPFGVTQPDCMKSPNTLIGGYRQMEELSKCDTVPLFNFPWMKGNDSVLSSNKIDTYNGESKWGPESPRNLLSAKRKLEEPEPIRPAKVPYYRTEGMGALFPDNQCGALNPFLRQSYNLLPMMADLSDANQNMLTNNLLKGTDSSMLNHFNLYPQLFSQHYAGGILT